MRNLKNYKVIFSTLSLVLLSTTISVANVYAAGSHDGPLPSLADFILDKKMYWINFLVYTCILVFVVKKIFVKAWSARRLAYIEAINSGKKMLEDSQVKLEEAKKQLSEASTEIADLKVRMLKDTDFEAARLVQLASEKADKIKNQASQSAAVEKRAALNKYQEKLVELAILRARTRVSAGLTSEVDSRLKDRVVGYVSGLIN